MLRRVAVFVVVVADVVVVATAVTARAAASGLMTGASSSSRAHSMISASDGEGSLSANKRPVVSKFHMSGWAEGISAGHSSGVVEELDGDGGIESNSIVSSAASDHTARAVCCT